MRGSLREIARRTGLSTSSVSLALRGLGRLSEGTRARVRAVADEMGYQQNPLLSRALSLVRQPEGTRYRETFAFILEYATETGPDYQKELHAGAEQRAASLACKLESFELSGKPSEHRRWSRIFKARGIRGLILFPRLESRQPRFSMEWDSFVAVEIGRTLWSPRNLHRVEGAEFHNLMETMHLLKRVGYKRIGMAVEPGQDRHQRGICYSAFLMAQQRMPAVQRIPILALEGPWNRTHFKAWMKKYKPDILLVHDVEPVCAWLEEMKMKIPRDVSLFNINVRRYDRPGPHQEYKWSGLRRDHAGIGRRAVEMVSNLLMNDEWGLAGNPSCWQVDDFWIPGETLARPIGEHISPEGFLMLRAPVSVRHYRGG